MHVAAEVLDALRSVPHGEYDLVGLMGHGDGHAVGTLIWQVVKPDLADLGGGHASQQLLRRDLNDSIAESLRLTFLCRPRVIAYPVTLDRPAITELQGTPAEQKGCRQEPP